MKLSYLDIELHDRNSQRKYLVHGYNDVLWTDNLDDAVRWLKV